MKKRNILILIALIIFTILIITIYNNSLSEAKNEGYKKGYIKGMIDEKYASIWEDCMISCKAVANESYESKQCVKECMRDSEIPEDFINKHVL